MKSWMLIQDPFADLRTGYPFGVLGMAISLELVIAYCLLSKSISLAVKWALSSSLFFLFVLVSSSRFVLGFQSCGCFGVLEVPQWTSLLLSIVVLALLVFQCGLTEVLKTYRSGFCGIRSWMAKYQLEILGASIAISLFMIVTYRPVKESIAQWLGQRTVAASPVLVDDVTLGDSKRGTATLTNTSNAVVSVLGIEKSCVCIALDFRKTIIAPGKSAVISFQITPKQTGDFHHRLICFLDSRHQQRVGVEILGSCNEEKNELSKR